MLKCLNAKQRPWHEFWHNFEHELVNPVPGGVRGDYDTVQKEERLGEPQAEKGK
jgi:hypothetical protein